MPFVNHEQEAACRAKAERDVAAGYFPKWDCDKYKNEVEGSYNKEWIPLTQKELRVYKGLKGGHYRIVKGEKFYAHQFFTPTTTKKNKSSAKKAFKKSNKSATKVFTGVRGGKYTLDVNGKKLYVRKK